MSKKGTKVVALVPTEDLSHLTDDEKISYLADAMASPQDLRTEEQLAVDLGFSPARIQALKRDPRFMEPVNARFSQALGSVQIEVYKHLLRRVSFGDVAAARLTLQAIGVIDTGGNKVQVNIGTGEAAADYSGLTDDELDLEIHRLLLETNPSDVTYANGKVTPLDGRLELLPEDDTYGDLGGSEATPGRTDAPSPEVQTDPPAPGTPTPDGAE